MTDGLHRLAEERSLALHREVARRLVDEPALVEQAVERILAWRERGVLATDYALSWLALLRGPRDRLLQLLTQDDEPARALRQTTPFTFVVGPRERWAIWRATKARWEEQK